VIAAVLVIWFLASVALLVLFAVARAIVFYLDARALARFHQEIETYLREAPVPGGGQSYCPVAPQAPGEESFPPVRLLPPVLPPSRGPWGPSTSSRGLTRSMIVWKTPGELTREELHDEVELLRERLVRAEAIAEERGRALEDLRAVFRRLDG
jgi:hypothetical protein